MNPSALPYAISNFSRYFLPCKPLAMSQPQHLLLILRQLRQLHIHNRKLLLQRNHLPGELALQLIQFRGILCQTVARRVAPAALAKLALVIFRTFAQPLDPLFEGGDAQFLPAYIFEIVDRDDFTSSTESLFCWLPSGTCICTKPRALIY